MTSAKGREGRPKVTGNTTEATSGQSPHSCSMERKLRTNDQADNFGRDHLYDSDEQGQTWQEYAAHEEFVNSLPGLDDEFLTPPPAYRGLCQQDDDYWDSCTSATSSGDERRVADEHPIDPVVLDVAVHGDRGGRHRPDPGQHRRRRVMRELPDRGQGDCSDHRATPLPDVSGDEDDSTVGSDQEDVPAVPHRTCEG